MNKFSFSSHPISKQISSKRSTIRARGEALEHVKCLRQMENSSQAFAQRRAHFVQCDCSRSQRVREYFEGFNEHHHRGVAKFNHVGKFNGRRHIHRQRCSWNERRNGSIWQADHYATRSNHQSARDIVHLSFSTAQWRHEQLCQSNLVRRSARHDSHHYHCWIWRRRLPETKAFVSEAVDDGTPICHDAHQSSAIQQLLHGHIGRHLEVVERCALLDERSSHSRLLAGVLRHSIECNFGRR